MSTIDVTLPNGLKLSGTPQQVAECAKALGHDLSGSGEYYLSESHGLIKIADMETTHLKNALLKNIRKSVEALSAEKDLRVVFDSLMKFFEDKTRVHFLYHLDAKLTKEGK